MSDCDFYLVRVLERHVIQGWILERVQRYKGARPVWQRHQPYTWEEVECSYRGKTIGQVHTVDDLQEGELAYPERNVSWGMRYSDRPVQVHYDVAYVFRLFDTLTARAEDGRTYWYSGERANVVLFPRHDRKERQIGLWS